MHRAEKVLILFMVKDQVSFNEKNYLSVVNQAIEKDVIVVSAYPVNVQNNFVVPVNEDYVLGIKLSLSIAKAMKKYFNDSYSHILKIDGDVWLGEGWLEWAVSKGLMAFGRGSILLLKREYVEDVLHGSYLPGYAEDVRNKFQAFALGYIPQIWENTHDSGNVVIPNMHVHKRESIYLGHDYYRMGYPFFIMILTFFAFLKNKHSMSIGIHYLSGWLFAYNNRVAQYEYSDLFRKKIMAFYSRKLLNFLHRSVF